MFGVSRAKRVTYSLDNKARARIVGGGGTESYYVSSGSEHSAEAEDDVNSDMFFNFPGNDEEDSPSPSANDSDLEVDQSEAAADSNVADLINPIVRDDSDEFRNALKGHVSRALQTFGCCDGDNKKKILRRKVMAYLRDRGYDAAVCKTKWKSGGGVSAGEYEFVDVVAPGGQRRRYLVDVDFRSEFEIARPTRSYELGLESLPRVLVGGIEEVRAILRAMSDAARRSLKSGGLVTPPWRKIRFMQNKWLGAYRRTVNVCPATASLRGEVMCRAVGFDGSLVLLPAAARTR